MELVKLCLLVKKTPHEYYCSSFISNMNHHEPRYWKYLEIKANLAKSHLKSQEKSHESCYLHLGIPNLATTLPAGSGFLLRNIKVWGSKRSWTYGKSVGNVVYDMDLNGDVIFMYLHMYICIFLYTIYIYMGGIFVASCWLRKSCGNVMMFFKKTRACERRNRDSWKDARNHPVTGLGIPHDLYGHLLV